MGDAVVWKLASCPEVAGLHSTGATATFQGRGRTIAEQQCGGARASGTHDEAGSTWNLVRWVSPLAIEESFVLPTHHEYPHRNGRD